MATTDINVDYSDESVALPSQPPRQPMPRFAMTKARQAPVSSGIQKMPDLTLNNAYKVLQFYQQEPEWLADPRTSSVANADFAQASKIIGMSMQLERLSSQAETARARNSMEKQVGNSLLKLAESGPDGAKIASRWYASGEDGTPLYQNPANWSAILSDYQAVAPVMKPAADIHEQRLDEYISSLKASGDPEKMRQAERHELILAERGRPKTGAGPRQTAVEKQEAVVSGIKASLIQSKRFMLAEPNDPKKKDDVAALQTKLAGAEATLAELKKQSSPAPSTESAAPAASTPPSSTPANVTQQEYETLKSGDLYWWNGKQIPKK